MFTAISTPLLLNTPYHQNETLQTFNLMLLFYLALRACECWNLKRWAAVGAVTGIAILTRGNINFFLPGLLAALIWAGRQHKAGPGRIAAAAGLFAAMALLVQLPFALHNTRVTGKLSGPSTAADAVLALGNSPEAPAGGRDPELPAGPMEYPEAYGRMMNRAENGIGVPAQMFEWMRREPAAFFELQLRKLLLFWDWREIPNNVSLLGPGGGAESSLILRWLLPGRSLVLLPLGLAGFVLAAVRAYRRRDVRLWLLVYCAAAYWAATALFYILSRFRAPILPLVAVAAAASRPGSCGAGGDPRNGAGSCCSAAAAGWSPPSGSSAPATSSTGTTSKRRWRASAGRTEPSSPSAAHPTGSITAR